MGPRAKSLAADIRVPQNREEAAAMIAEFGAALREIDLIETAMKEKLAAVKTAAEQEATPHTANAKQLFEGLKVYCAANRQALTQDGKTKTVDLGTGKVSWRWNPSKVKLSGEVDDIIARILARAESMINRGENASDYLNFLRTKQEIDKEAMLKQADLARTINGVTIGRSGETFEVEPFGAELAEAI